VNDQQKAAAAQMGTRAGEAFRDTGVPQRNPFRGKAPELAAAWRAAYLAAATPKAVRGR
jgi:hypothetical protein